MRCDACGGEYLKLEVVFPPTSSQELRPAGEGLFRHGKTGRLYRVWRLCESCMEVIKAHGGSTLMLPFKVKGGEEKNERKGGGSGKPSTGRLDNSASISLLAWV